MLLDDLGAYLETANCGVVGTSIFLGRMPIDVTGLALRHAGGLPPQESFDGPHVLIERPLVQVLMRHGSYRTARLTIERVAQAFLALSNCLINGTWYLSTEPTAPPTWLEHDENARHVFVCTVAVERVFRETVGGD